MSQQTNDGWHVDGRPITNVEMYQRIAASRAERQTRYEATGVCCDAGPYADGACPHSRGQCHLVELAEGMIRAHDRRTEQ